jgi:SAM-dependent methyltransferase
MTEKIIDYVSQYYTEKIDTHGPTPQGVDWNGSESQELRFEQLLKICLTSDSPYTIIDYGCGYGALFEFLRQRQNHFRYIGYDCSERMIENARRLHHNAAQCNFVSGSSCTTTADYSVASGIFNVRGQYSDQQWLDYCLDTINELNRLSSLGFSFNMLTRYSDQDKMRDYLYYADPCLIFDYCKRQIGRNVALLHDYDLYEFTILVRK